MAEFTHAHTIRLTPEEVQQAILDLALAKGRARGLDINAHTFHTKAAVSPTSDNGAVVAWKDE